MNTKKFTIEELDEIKQAVYQVSDAYYALKRITDTNPLNADLNRLVSDLKELTQGDGASNGYFTNLTTQMIIL